MSLLISRLATEPESLHRAHNLEGPEFFSWDRDSELLATLIDEIRSLQRVIIAVNSKKGRSGKIERYPRPEKKVIPRTLDDAFAQFMAFQSN